MGSFLLTRLDPKLRDSSLRETVAVSQAEIKAIHQKRQWQKTKQNGEDDHISLDFWCEEAKIWGALTGLDCRLFEGGGDFCQDGAYHE